MWTIYLICGPNEGLMRWLLDKTTSVMTDMGAELGIIDQPDMLPAFLAHLAGASILSLRGTVPRSSRLIRYALRISGWSHMWGSLMAKITRHVDRWPKILHYCRALCRFFFSQPHVAEGCDQRIISRCTRHCSTAQGIQSTILEMAV